jgi:hypothetical protein
VIGDLVLAARVRGAGLAVLGGALSVLLLAVIPGGPLAVPGRAGVFALVWPLVPAVGAAMLPSLLHRHRFVLREGATPRTGHRHAADGAVFIVTQFALLATCIWFPTAILLRNSTMFIGFVALSAALLGARQAWFPLVFAVALTWLLGTGEGGTVRPWALPLHGPGSSAAWAGAGMMAVLGTLALVASGRR